MNQFYNNEIHIPLTKLLDNITTKKTSSSINCSNNATAKHIFFL